jgi:hypothetical protein
LQWNWNGAPEFTPEIEQVGPNKVRPQL